MINVLLSIVGPRLTKRQSLQFSQVAQWVVLNERNGRICVDALGSREALGAALNALDQLGRAPIVIGAWERDGTPAAGYPLVKRAWLAVAPDEFDLTDPENQIAVRPTRWREVHRWQGWAPKQ